MDNKKKILVVDDDEIQLTTAELFLKNEYEVFKMSSGSEALEYLSSNKFVPDLIMLDIIMPNMDGWVVFNKIKAIDFLKNVPIVFLTSIEEEAEKKKAQQIGAADYITKPYNMTDLKSRVKGAIERNESKNPRR